MDIRSFFDQLVETFDVNADFKSSGQLLLKNAPELLQATAPPTLTISSGGGKGVVTPTPWVAYMNPDETSSARHGIYVVYLLSADKEKLVLILGQGVSELIDKYGVKDARAKLTGEALRLREELAPENIARYSDPVDLRSKGALQRSYSAGTICCRSYDTAHFPSTREMQEDLDSFLYLYQLAIDAKQRLLLTEPGVFETSSSTRTNHASNPLLGFKPKSSEDYRSTLVGKVLVKSRRHELLVKNFGQSCQAKGFEAFTPHPVDLVLRLVSKLILVEAKIIYKGDAMTAVRGVVGQLLDYRYHLYPEPEQPYLVGLFSESIGDDFVEFLASLSIASVWWTHDGWKSSPLAEAWGIKEIR
jgi:hypothetical protein